MRWKTKVSEEILIRCNSKDYHRNKFGDPPSLDDFHIHLATTKAISKGLENEQHAKTTSEFADYKRAIEYLINRVNVKNKDKFDHLINESTLFGDVSE
ncbi:MAG: hypothetical protein R2883_06150 [Caldisericia bacterium]